MIVNEYVRFSRYGGFGAEAGAVKLELWPGAGVGFNESWARDNWLGGSWLNHIKHWNLADYEPISSVILDRAIQKQSDFISVIELGNTEAEAAYNKIMSELKRLTKAIDSQVKNDFDMWGKASDAAHAKHAQSLTSLNTSITKLANAKIPASEEEIEAAQKKADKEKAKSEKKRDKPYTPGQSQSALTSGGGGTRPDTYYPPPDKEKKAESPAWLIPAGIGAGALLLGGITFAIVRKKSNK
jgi:hypothetical protein